ncbi:MAG: type II toxin-antitoxin system HicB family antitoxin [Chloroflexi bacterium]|nr:type II toxin-antitoxin system HicB family antitoxin [Chloroflexota bacterium]
MQQSTYLLSVEIQPLEEGGFLALCSALPGCHAEGETIAQALDNLADVARSLIELRLEDGLPLPEDIVVLAKPGKVLHGEILVSVARA